MTQETDRAAIRQGTDHRAVIGQTLLLQDLEHLVGVRVADLDDGAQLLAEERRQVIRPNRAQIHLQPAVARKGHLAQRREQAPVRAVVVGEEKPLAASSWMAAKKRMSRSGSSRSGPIGLRVTELPVDLGQAGAAEAVPALSKVDQDEIGIAAVGAQLRGQRGARVAHRGKGRDDQ